jgi:hypothetical protein
LFDLQENPIWRDFYKKLMGFKKGGERIIFYDNEFSSFKSFGKKPFDKKSFDKKPFDKKSFDKKRRRRIQEE